MADAPAVSRGQTRILIVEDERLNRLLLETALDHGGYAWVSAEDGQAGWEILVADPAGFDLILLDWRMPRMSGMELLVKIKADERLRDLPVVMQTAYAEPEDVVKGIKAGVSYYLAKPLNLQVLMSVVAQAVREYEALRRLQGDLDRQTSAMTLMERGVFSFRSLDEGNMLAVALARCCAGSRSLVIGLSEMFCNAVEHGNLGIDYAEKSRLLSEGGRDAEIARRMALPPYAERQVTVEVERLEGRIRFTIRDQGDGFDWRKYLDIDPARAFSSHGRGIAMARHLYFDDVVYVGRGNEVVCTVLAPGGIAAGPEAVTQDKDTASSDDLARARAMQTSLLPSEAVLADIRQRTGFHVSGLFQPSGEIGGDIWGAAALDENRVVLYLADCSGHGVAAALDTFRLDTLIRHQDEDWDDPGKFLTRLNGKLSRIMPTGHYCTMVYGVLDKRNARFTYAAAAFPKPLAVDPSSRRTWDGDGRGLPLGVSGDAVYGNRVMDVPPGALLFLHSDALSEARLADGRPIGCSGVSLGLAEAAGTGTCPPDASSLVNAILARSDQPPAIRDDLTAVCCFYPGP
ncbi:two-component response regulator [Paramagnetospirillum magnetotacticum MS-1]|uniref:Two-component response regulator n=1 Tax=Paramagnetospirillum magnetotacticum MS-1 TaxID=272627 RepID=A0A0C2UWG5_PARME|nr:SpoIIE family protein phosphatase [Paramagnetospirillum magnetotacticum]KIL97141.1 two-component response regulator [Paramagnetospirillum magnetotacticum MS-1]